MKSNNGWYSVHDAEHRPESGEEVLCLGLLEYAKDRNDPFEDPGERIYYVATWYEVGDLLYQEVESDDLEERLFGRPETVERAGFYIQEGIPGRRKNTDGGRLEEYTIFMRWSRLKLDTEGIDGLICWKRLDYPSSEE